MGIVVGPEVVVGQIELLSEREAGWVLTEAGPEAAALVLAG